MAATMRFTCYATKLDRSTQETRLSGELLERARDARSAVALEEAGDVGAGHQDEVVASREPLIQ